MKSLFTSLYTCLRSDYISRRQVYGLGPSHGQGQYNSIKCQTKAVPETDSSPPSFQGERIQLVYFSTEVASTFPHAVKCGTILRLHIDTFIWRWYFFHNSCNNVTVGDSWLCMRDLEKCLHTWVTELECVALLFSQLSPCHHKADTFMSAQNINIYIYINSHWASGVARTQANS